MLAQPSLLCATARFRRPALPKANSQPFVQCSARVKARRSADERNEPLKLGGAKLERDLIDAALMQQQDGRGDAFGHSLIAGPAQSIRMKIHPETIGHGEGTYPALWRAHTAPLRAGARGMRLTLLPSTVCC